MHVPLLMVKHVPSASEVGPAHVIVGTAFVTRNHAPAASSPHDAKVGAAVGAVGDEVGAGVGAAVGTRVGTKVGAAVGASDVCVEACVFKVTSDWRQSLSNQVD